MMWDLCCDKNRLRGRGEKSRAPARTCGLSPECKHSTTVRGFRCSSVSLSRDFLIRFLHHPDVQPTLCPPGFFGRTRIRFLSSDLGRLGSRLEPVDGCRLQAVVCLWFAVIWRSGTGAELFVCFSLFLAEGGRDGR